MLVKGTTTKLDLTYPRCNKCDVTEKSNFTQVKNNTKIFHKFDTCKIKNCTTVNSDGTC